MSGTPVHLRRREGRLFVSTREGRLHASARARPAADHAAPVAPLPSAAPRRRRASPRCSTATGMRGGLRRRLGVGAGRSSRPWSGRPVATDRRRARRRASVGEARATALHAAGIYGNAQRRVLPPCARSTPAAAVPCSLLLVERRRARGRRAQRPYEAASLRPYARRWLAPRTTAAGGIGRVADGRAARGRCRARRLDPRARRRRQHARLARRAGEGPARRAVVRRPAATRASCRATATARSRRSSTAGSSSRARTCCGPSTSTPAGCSGRRRCPGSARSTTTLAHQPGANAARQQLRLARPTASTSPTAATACGSTRRPASRRGRYVLPPLPGEKTPRRGFLNVAGDYLIGGASRPTPSRTGGKNGDVPRPASSQPADRPGPHTGKAAVDRDGRDGFRHNTICAGGGRLYAIDRVSAEPADQAGKATARTRRRRRRVVAFDLATGKELWHDEADVVRHLAELLRRARRAGRGGPPGPRHPRATSRRGCGPTAAGRQGAVAQAGLLRPGHDPRRPHPQAATARAPATC